MPLLGIDFDNTIVCYDRLFHDLAVAEGWITPDVPANKTAVRDTMRKQGMEEQWILLQGIAYGPKITGAEPFEGALAFFEKAKAVGQPCVIISHKTRHPVRGEPHDLHAAARTFLEAKGFLGDRTGLSHDHVYLELTKADKLARVASLGCQWFIDDLPELLAEPTFPGGVERILFDPTGLSSPGPYTMVTSWAALGDRLLSAGKP